MAISTVTNSNKVLSSIPPPARGLCVGSLASQSKDFHYLNCEDGVINIPHVRNSASVALQMKSLVLFTAFHIIFECVTVTSLKG